MGIFEDFLNAEGHEPHSNPGAKNAIREAVAASLVAVSLTGNPTPAMASNLPNFEAISDQAAQAGLLTNHIPLNYFKKTKEGWKYIDGKGGQHTLSNEHFELIKKVSREYKMPLLIVLAMIAKESSFNPKAENPGSGAMGWFQFLPSTLYERLYKDADKIGRPELKSLIKAESIKNGKKVIAKYSPVDEKAKEKLKTLAFDPESNLRLGMEYARVFLRKLQMDLYYLRDEGAKCYALTPADLYAAHFAGPKAAANIIRDARLERTHGVGINFSAAAKKNETNQALLLNQYGKPVTAAQLMAFFEKIMGDNKPLDMICPDTPPPTPRGIEDLIRHPS